MWIWYNKVRFLAPEYKCWVLTTENRVEFRLTPCDRSLLGGRICSRSYISLSFFSISWRMSNMTNRHQFLLFIYHPTVQNIGVRWRCIVTHKVWKLQISCTNHVCIGHLSTENLFRHFVLWKKRKFSWNIYQT